MSRVAYEKHNELSVSIPSRKTLSINHIAKDVRLGYKGKFISTRDFSDFDIILGMHWLESNHGSVPCHKK